MVVLFKTVNFRNRGVMEKVVEVWCRLLEGGRPPSPLALEGDRMCKVGWLERDVAISIGKKPDGKCTVVHKIFIIGDCAE